MSFSNIAAAKPNASLGPRADGGPHPASSLANAWALVRQIRLLEFRQAESARWASSVNRLATAVRDSLSEHVAGAEQDSLLARHPAEASGTTKSACCQAAEHATLLAAASDFARLCQITNVASIWAVIEIAERAIELELLLARHHNRLVSLGNLVQAEAGGRS